MNRLKARLRFINHIGLLYYPKMLLLCQRALASCAFTISRFVHIPLARFSAFRPRGGVTMRTPGRHCNQEIL